VSQVIDKQYLLRFGAFLLIDKEAGLTSHDVVLKVRRIFSHQKCGHSGTLDPFATGLLIVAVGKTTRLLKYLTGLPKQYTGEFELGKATDTYDLTGNITNEAEVRNITLDHVTNEAQKFQGTSLQMPPMYSAVKYQGKKLYEYARLGLDVQRKPRQIFVESFKVDKGTEANCYNFEITCSSGTYVRSLIHDLGLKLGCYAYLKRLKRTFIGPFSWEEAVSIQDLNLSDLHSALEIFSRFMPVVFVKKEQIEKIKNGAPFLKTELGAQGEGPWTAADNNGNLLAIYEKRSQISLKPSVVLTNLD
jgi:tRNA pseudouridine55 synthase